MSPSSGTDSPFLPLAAAGRDGPDFFLETQLQSRGARIIAGIDEAGRGPLAGPVVAAAVVLDRNRLPHGLDDSKKLDHGAREALFIELVASAQIAWSAVSAQEIDRINILQATLVAMTRAANLLPVEADALLIDGRDVPVALSGRGRAVVRGDATSQSIAAASIVAKVIRDRIMTRSCTNFPGYGFSRHMGYATRFHREAIAKLGPCPIHRLSFSPFSSGEPCTRK